jgi:hypothetical protein
MSVSSKTLGPSNITGNKRLRVGPRRLGSSSERDVFPFGSSCESPGRLNIPLSDSFDGDRVHPATRARLERAVVTLERQRLRAT